MSYEISIKVNNLSKCYQIYDRPHHRLLQMFHRGYRQYYQEFWALKGISLNVQRGKTVGIIGRNGSGKSTLLKLICGTLNPTSGEIKTNGRIAAILELGSGFNPEFTGRENVYLKASILGLSNSEIDERFDSIATFAEVGYFIDQPVRTYSSGMLVRLAFAVSVNVEPEILIVDEALSVGDERFQRKCFSRIESIKNSGATILFVSHSGSTVVQLCDRVILLEKGMKIAEGSPKKIYGYYQRLLYAPDELKATVRKTILENKIDMTNENQHIFKSLSCKNTRSITAKNPGEDYDPELTPSSTIEYEPRGAIIHTPNIHTVDGKKVNSLIRSNRYIYSYYVDFMKDAYNVRFGMMVKTKLGVELGGAVSFPPSQNAIAYIAAGTTYLVEFNFCCSLNQGPYFLNAGVTGEISGTNIVLHRLLDIAMFKVQPENNKTVTGIVDFDCKTSYSVLKN